MEADKIIEIYYDHYKETFELSRQAQRRRNKNYVILCALEAVAFLMASNRNWVNVLLKNVLESQLEQTITIGDNALRSLVWVLIAYTLMRYVQDTVYIERHYNYLDNLEKRISTLLGDDLFNREGSYYLSDYPTVLNLVDVFYKTLSPLLFLVINVVLISKEWIMGIGPLPLVCDTVVFAIILVMSLLYYLYVHPRVVEVLRGSNRIARAMEIVERFLRKV